MRADQAGDITQHAVTDLVAMAVVVALEVVDVDQRQAQWATAPRGVAFLLQ